MKATEKKELIVKHHEGLSEQKETHSEEQLYKFIKAQVYLLPDRETAEAVLALCQLIPLRNCYNRGWVPDWEDRRQRKWVIHFCDGIAYSDFVYSHHTLLAFKSEEIRDKFRNNFFELIKALEPLYGVKKGSSDE